MRMLNLLAAVLTAAVVSFAVTHATSTVAGRYSRDPAVPRPAAVMPASNAVAAAVATPPRGRVEPANPAAQPAAGVSTATADADLKAELAKLRAQVRRHAELLHSMQVAAQTVAHEPDEIDLADLQEQELRQEADSQAANDEYHDALLADFELQDEDSDWSAQVSNRLNNVASAGLGRGLYLSRADCRSTLCRFEVEYTDQATRHAFENLLPQVAMDVASGVNVMPDGEMRSIFYLQAPR